MPAPDRAGVPDPADAVGMSGAAASNNPGPDTHTANCSEGRGMRLNPYLMFDGQCEAAFRFYEQALGGRIVGMMTYADTPGAEHVSPEMRGRIIHARLEVGDTVLMGSDDAAGHYDSHH